VSGSVRVGTGEMVAGTVTFRKFSAIRILTAFSECRAALKTLQGRRSLDPTDEDLSAGTPALLVASTRVMCRRTR